MKQKLEKVLKANHNYSFHTDTISFKSENGKHYIEGYISTSDMDLYNDIITPSALKSMLRQINESVILLDYEHEAWRDDASILPVGKIIKGKLDDRGLWVKAELNNNSPKFKNLWGSIKDGFVKAFSVAFKPLKTVMKTVGDSEVRLIEELQLLNVALTGVPVNQSAVMTDFGMKAVMLRAIEDMEQIEGKIQEECILVPKSLIKKVEVYNMTEEKVLKDEATEEPKIEEKKEEAPVVEEKKEEVSEKPKEVEADKVEAKALDKVNEELSKLRKTVETQEAELKSLKESPVFKSGVPEQPEKIVEKSADVLGLIR